VQRAIVHVLVVVVRLSCVVLSVELVKRAALEIRERPLAEATRAVALGRREHPVRRRGRILSMVMRLHLRKCGKTRGRVARRSGSVAGARAVRNRDAFAAAAREPALQLRDAELELRDHRRFVGRKRVRDEMHCRLGILIRHARSSLMYTVAKMFFSKREQHNVGRRRGNGNWRELGDHDVAGEVDTGGLEHALSGQVVRDVRGATTFLTFSVASFLLPLLLAHLLLSECRSMRWLGRAPNSRGSDRDGRQWPSVGRSFGVGEPERSHRRSRSRTRRPGRRL